MILIRSLIAVRSPVVLISMGMLAICPGLSEPLRAQDLGNGVLDFTFAPLPAADQEAVELLRDFNCELERSSKATSASFDELRILHPNESHPREMSSKDLERLRILPNLKRLNIFGDLQIDDTWMPVIAQCKNLEVLSIAHSRVTNKGLAHLAKLPLREVNLSRCESLTDEAMETVADWEKLEVLELTGVPITDVGMHTIRGLGQLRVFYLNGDPDYDCRITNESVKVLGRFTKLKELYIHGMYIDQRHYEQLRKQLPECNVHWLMR